LQYNQKTSSHLSHRPHNPLPNASNYGYVPDRTRHSYRSIRKASRKLLFSCRRTLSLLSAISREMSNSCRRISLLCTQRLDLRGVDLGQYFQNQTNGTVQLDTKTQACSTDIRRFSEHRGALTTSDALLFRRVWLMGYESGVHSHCTQPSNQP
jgi:hypothetical protein